MKQNVEEDIEKTAYAEFRKLLFSLIQVTTEEIDISQRIDMLLDNTMAFYDSDRAYVIEGDEELVTGINTHERCAPDISSQKDTLKDMAPDVYLHWLGIFRRHEEIVIPDMEVLKTKRPNEYKYFNDSAVTSIIVVPFSKGASQGFVGVDNPKKHRMDALPLRLLSCAIALEINEFHLICEKDALMDVSKYPKDIVYAHLLGRFQITCHGGAIYQEQFTAQGHALLTILLLNPTKIFSSNDLYEVIEQNKEVGNPTHIVSNAVYKLRTVLDVIGLKNLILYDRGSYFLNQQFHVKTDADSFLKLYHAIKKTTCTSQRLELCHSALKLYQNPLPEALSCGIRWILECSDMNAKFLNIARECARLHLECGDYSLAYDIAKYALEMDPQESELMLLIAKAMKQEVKPGLKAYARKIAPFLTKTERKQLDHIILTADESE